jgi:hypothetical protein
MMVAATWAAPTRTAAAPSTTGAADSTARTAAASAAGAADSRTVGGLDEHSDGVQRERAVLAADDRYVVA